MTVFLSCLTHSGMIHAPEEPDGDTTDEDDGDEVEERQDFVRAVSWRLKLTPFMIAIALSVMRSALVRCHLNLKEDIAEQKFTLVLHRLPNFFRFLPSHIEGEDGSCHKVIVDNNRLSLWLKEEDSTKSSYQLFPLKLFYKDDVSKEYKPK
jgi:hypothetical protein